MAQRPIRITHLISADLWAGAEASTFELVKELSRDEDFEVSVVVLNPGRLEKRLSGVGIPVSIEPEAGRGFRSLLGAVRCRLAGADLVHSHRYKENVLAALSGRLITP